jgi:hypothetical protein
MFTTEQSIRKTLRIPSGKAIFRSGMPLAKGDSMKKRFTYKEFSLLLGIVVALLIAVTLWAGKPADSTSVDFLRIPMPSLPTIARNLVEAAIGRLL